MNTIIMLVTNLLFLLLSITYHFDDRYPSSTKIKYKYRVKDNSIFRKIIRFKDRQFHPCNYFKIIPIYLYILISVVNIIILIIDLATNFYISINYETILLIINTTIIIISILYALSIIIWWEIVDYKEFRFTAEEKKQIKALKKMRRKKRNK